MKLCDRIHIVASGDSGFALTDSLDCTVYLVEGKDGCVLIDSGSGRDTEKILEQIRQTGHKPEEICGILLTHGHGDHAAGAKALKSACNATVFALEETARYVEDGDQQALSVDVARAAGVYGADFSVPPCEVNAVGDGQILQLGGMEITAYRSDGHCMGHCCYEIMLGKKRALFSGDSVFAGGKIAIQAIWDCNLQSYIKTCGKLNARKPDMLFPSHGPFLLNRGYQSTKGAIDSLERLEIPYNN